MGKKKMDVMLREKEIFKHGNNPDPAKRGKDEAYVPGCEHNGIEPEVADIIWNKMEKFAEYA